MGQLRGAAVDAAANDQRGTAITQFLTRWQGKRCDALRMPCYAGRPRTRRQSPMKRRQLITDANEIA